MIHNGYRCSECGKSIGLIADKKGNPELFRCPTTGLIAKAQQAIRGKPKSKPKDSFADTRKSIRNKKLPVVNYSQEPWNIGKNLDLI